MSDLSDKEIEQYKKALLHRKQDLENWSANSLQSRNAVELDQTRQGRLSRQDAMMQQEMAKASERNRQVEISKINAALKRVEEGDFGYCMRCDEMISRKRLELDPAISLCIDCAH